MQENPRCPVVNLGAVLVISAARATNIRVVLRSPAAGAAARCLVDRGQHAGQAGCASPSHGAACSHRRHWRGAALLHGDRSEGAHTFCFPLLWHDVRQKSFLASFEAPSPPPPGARQTRQPVCLAPPKQPAMLKHCSALTPSELASCVPDAGLSLELPELPLRGAGRR